MVIEMNARELLEQVKQGTVSVEEAEAYFRKKPFEDMGYAKLDLHRQVRSGFPEVVFCSRKEDDSCVLNVDISSAIGVEVNIKSSNLLMKSLIM